MRYENVRDMRTKEGLGKKLSVKASLTTWLSAAIDTQLCVGTLGAHLADRLKNSKQKTTEI